MNDKQTIVNNTLESRVGKLEKNQDFKIYGKLSEDCGVPAKYCGELYAAYCRANSVSEQASFIDGFVFSAVGDSISRLLSVYNYIDAESAQIESLRPNHSNAAYYDAIWAIQQAVYAYIKVMIAEGASFRITDTGEFLDDDGGQAFINEDGYVIKGTAADGKLASLYLGEKAEHPENYAVIHLESLLPLVGELPLETTEIW